LQCSFSKDIETLPLPKRKGSDMFFISAVHSFSWMYEGVPDSFPPYRRAAGGRSQLHSPSGSAQPLQEWG